MISSYQGWAHRRLTEYLAAKGFEVVNDKAHPKTATGSIQSCDLGPEEVIEFGVENCRPEADALFCACTGWCAVETAERLEELTGKPVVTANQATIWSVSRALGITEPIHGFGRLLEDLAAVPSR